MNARELFKPMLYSFFIIFSCALIGAFVILHLTGEPYRFVAADLIGLFILAMLTNSTQLVLYSRRTLSPGQITFRFIIITPIVLLIIYAVMVYKEWIIYIARLPELAIWAIIVFILLIICAVLIVDLSFINEKLKSMAVTKERDYYLYQYKVMQESIEQVSAIRHDIKSHMAIIRGYASKSQDITDYLNNLLEEMEDSEIYSDTKNIAFDSIINFKLARAKVENIKLDVNINIPVELNIEMTDVAIIMGNLLDNALDAMSKMDEKLLKLDIDYSKGILYIQIDNTFDGIIKYAQRNGQKEKNVITRKNSDEHGQGLKNIKRSVEKYNGHMEITHEGNLFSVRMLLYIDN